MRYVNAATISRTTAVLLLLSVLAIVLAGTLAACRPGRTTTASPAASGGGTLNLADEGPITLDPAVAGDASSSLYIQQLFGGLVRLDEDLAVVPDIARTWDKSPDGKAYTFHLRQDVKFHDGRPVTAADFKYSWQRALDPATQSTTAGTYLIDIVGAVDVVSGKAAELQGVQVLDDLTLRVTVDAPKAYFLYKMAYPTAFVVDKENVKKGAEWWRKPNGTGPFKLKDWQRDQALVLARNDSYHGAKAKLSQVVFKLFGGMPVSLYQSGDIDVAYTGGSFLAMVTDPSNPLSKELSIYPELSFGYIGFDTARPPFDDVSVRQAFTMAVDKERVMMLSTGGTVAPAYGILPPGLPGYDSSLEGLRFDPDKARQLIAASKYGDVSRLPEITITTSGWGGLTSGIVGGVIEEWRRNLGVEVKVRQLEPEPFLYLLHEEKDNMYDLGWIADYPDPQDFLDILLHSGSASNYGDYSNAAVDSLLDRAAIEQDRETRLSLYRQAERAVVQDAAVIPLYFTRSYVLVKPYVKGYTLNSLGLPSLNKVWIER